MSRWNPLTLPTLLRRTFRKLFTAPCRPAQNQIRFRPGLDMMEDRTVPSADLFGDATLLTGAVVRSEGSNVGATGEAGEPFHLSYDETINSVWWQWTADTDGPVEVNTFGSNFDTILAVYVGDAVDNLSLVASNDDALNLQSQVVFEAQAGTTYYIAVDGFQTETGSIILNLSTAPTSGGDPPIINDQTFTVDENADAFTLVGYIEASDPDGNRPLSYRLITLEGGSDVHEFVIDDSGRITVAPGAVLNYEQQSSYTLTVEVSYSGEVSQTATATITIDLNDLNESPVFESQDFVIDENSTGEVGIVIAFDPDGDQWLTYTILDGNTGGAFALNDNGYLTIANPAAINFETNPTFTLTVQVTDSGNPALSTTQTITVTLNDVNEAPVAGTVAPVTLSATSPNGTAVGTVTGSDPDAGQTLTFAIVSGNPNGAFGINPATGVITVANSAALGSAGSVVTLTVRVSDSGNPALSDFTTVTINLINQGTRNYAPVLDKSGSMRLNQVTQKGSNPGTLVSELLASAGGTRITDANAGAVQGIAIIDADTSRGDWQFSTDGGQTWQSLGKVSGRSARLLAADEFTRIRFVPDAGYTGTITNGIRFRAWDQTTGTNGGRANTTRNGGSTAFSRAVEKASIVVNPADIGLAGVRDAVQRLIDSGALNQGRGKALQNQLAAVQKQLDRGNESAAADELRDFIAEVKDFAKRGQLTKVQAQLLIDDAQDALAKLRRK